VFANMAAFYKTYDVKEGDGLYLPPEQRVKIWQ
jgi:predicted metalloendopeptidase